MEVGPGGNLKVNLLWAKLETRQDFINKLCFRFQQTIYFPFSY